MQQHTRLMAYEESATTTTRELERLRHEKAIQHSGARPPLEQDRELQDAYHRLSDAKHGWNYTRMLLDITREELDIRTHIIVPLEHHVETQDVELEERAEMIADLEQQLLELQEQAPPKAYQPRGDLCHVWHR
jgi:cellobiose phosphorylase